MSSTADAAPAVDATQCQLSGFDAESQIAERDGDLEVLFYTAADGDRRLTLDFYFSLGAVDGPQDLALTGEGLDACAVCLIARTGCGSLTCQTSFMPVSGSLSIATMGEVGADVEGSLEDVVFAEVTVDPGTQATTWIPGGARWCFDRYDFQAEVTAP